MKELIGKAQKIEPRFPKKLVIDNNDIMDPKEMAEKFINFFTNIGPNLASKIPKATKPFLDFVKQAPTTMAQKELSVSELKEAFFSLKSNKSSGYDDINFNVVGKCFGELNEPLLYVFNSSLEHGVFPDSLKIAMVTPLFKSGDPANISNYRPISVLPCFSKILERIMYNRLYKYMIENDLLYSKQFGFRNGHSTEHAIVQLVDQMHESFEKDQYTLGVFIDLSKAFDTVDHSILLQKLEIYGVNGINLEWFKSYLSCRQQFMKIDEKHETDPENITCGVPQGSILGPLLFIIYVNDLPNSTKILDPIMFADDTNLFFANKSIKDLFSTVNEELNKIDAWFIANKLSLNVLKTKFSLFHKASRADDIPLKLPKLKIRDHEIDRVVSIKFLGVLLDEHLSWKEHIKYIENKVSKSIGLLYRAKPFLNKKALLALYYSYIHTYLNYANLAWGSGNRTTLKKLCSQQKHAVRIIHNKTKFESTKDLFKTDNILNIFKMNILKTVLFMHKINSEAAPPAFRNRFQKVSHNYPTHFSNLNYKLPKLILNKCRFRISMRGPKIWNSFLSDFEKEIKSYSLFKLKVKAKLLIFTNELMYF